MKIVYLDCASGISGDMMLGALVDAGVSLDRIQAGIDSLGLPSCRLVTEEVKRHGFRATNLTVRHEPEHAHRHLHHITDMIDGSRLTDAQKELATRIFTRLGEAEAKVHGTSIRKVHFHEVGAVDSIADIVGTAIAVDLLEADRIVCSPVPTGRGSIEIAHGRVSVPAPATAELLKGVPLADSSVDAELTTPTGAAIVATLIDEFRALPPMTIDVIGYGAGDRDLKEQANLLRVLIGHDDDDSLQDQICVLETNLDDVSGEVIGYCADRLLEIGALDVHTTAIQMKKNRPGVKLTVLCAPDRREAVEAVVFRETGTLGIRYSITRRNKLRRETHVVTTRWGEITGKVARRADGATEFSPEYESCRSIAQRHDVPLREVYEEAKNVFLSER